jgi:hypothetical protein
MQLVSCQNSSGICGNHRNNMPILAMGITDIIMPVATVVGCCAFTDLVPPRSLKLGLAYLKTKAC